MILLSKLSARKLSIILLIVLCICSSLILLLISTNSVPKRVNKLIKNGYINRPRILCLVTTQPKNHRTSAQAIKDTWGRRCDLLYFVSSESEPSLPVIKVSCEKDDHDHLWCKNRNGIIYAVDNHRDQFDWLLKTDDDTYIIMENLRNLLVNYDHNQPIWFGCLFALGGNRNITYMSGGI